MIKIHTTFLICFLLLSSAQAKDAVGMFMSAKGDVKVTSDEKTSPAKVGMKYFVGDVVSTGPDGRAKITMKDRNNIFVSPNSKFSLDTYEAGKNRNVEINLKEGKVRNEVNNKYNDDKNKFIIKTPTAVAGVRGTDFVTSFNTQTQITEVVTISGSVVLNTFSGSGNVVIPAGQTSSVKANEAPLPPQVAPPEKINEVKQEFNVSVTEPKTEPGQPQTDSASTEGEKKEREPASDAADTTTPETEKKGKGRRERANPESSEPKRVVDKEDQSPDTFERSPNAGTSSSGSNPLTGGGTGVPGANFNPGGLPVGSSPVGAVLQNQGPAKVKVIVNPPSNR